MGDEKAIYAPGELAKVRGNLGAIDDAEAKRVAKLLGGEVGVEKTSAGSSQSAGSNSGGSKMPKRRIELVSEEDDNSVLKEFSSNPLDDPSKPFTQSYSERLKMDKLASGADFEIKSLWQVIHAAISFLVRPTDYVSSYFVSKRLSEYYKDIEILTVATRNMFPRNNIERNAQIKRMSPFAYSVLDTIRYWNIERIAGDISKMQAHPRAVKVKDLEDIVKAVFKPLFILEKLSPKDHIKSCYNILYKHLFVENPQDSGKYQKLVQSAIGSFLIIHKEIRYRLYPLFMKLVSDQCFSYDEFFLRRRNRIMALLGVTEEDQIVPQDVIARKIIPNEKMEEGEEEIATPEKKEEKREVEKEKQSRVSEAERSIVAKGLRNLETVFPEAGWDKLSSYPDLYPYFRSVLGLKKSFELLSPNDPMQQCAILILIVEELLVGLRSVRFTAIENSDRNEDLAEEMNTIINNWNDYVEETFFREYLKRLEEYCNTLAESSESRNSPFARRLLDEMCFAKRLYFFPFLHYATQNSATAQGFQRKNLPSISREVRKLRHALTIAAESIEQTLKEGESPDAQISCPGIENPWKPYVIQVASPLWRRLDALLGVKKRNNASLIFFTLSVVAVLDFFLNNSESWAYDPPSETIFRSVNNAGVLPQFGVDEKIDAEAIFKRKMKERAERKA